MRIVKFEYERSETVLEIFKQDHNYQVDFILTDNKGSKRLAIDEKDLPILIDDLKIMLKIMQDGDVSEIPE